jgi:hypothetical protein
MQELLFWLGLATAPGLVLLVFATLFFVNERQA